MDDGLHNGDDLLMGAYIFLPQENLENGDDISGEILEYSHINSVYLHNYLMDAAKDWADWHNDPVTCFKLEPVSLSLTNVTPRAWDEEANGERRYEADTLC